MLCVPDIGTDPVQAPEASQAVAVVADHVSAAADPIARETLHRWSDLTDTVCSRQQR